MHKRGGGRTTEQWQGEHAEEAGGAGDPSLRWESAFPPDAQAVGRCRLGVASALQDAGIAPVVLADALVVLGEMTANAVRHARTEFVVTVTLVAGVIRFEVFDRDTRPPALLTLDPESTGGRGLHMVAGLARDWGWLSTETDGRVEGKRVWAELAAEGGRP